MKPVPHGEPYAGKLHVRFDEGAGVPDNKGRPALLYTLNHRYRKGLAREFYMEGAKQYLDHWVKGAPLGLSMPTPSESGR